MQLLGIVIKSGSMLEGVVSRNKWLKELKGSMDRYTEILLKMASNTNNQSINLCDTVTVGLMLLYRCQINTADEITHIHVYISFG